MSHSLVDVDNRIEQVNTDLNTKIDNTTNDIRNIITKDNYNLYRVTGITDWHLRFEYYQISGTDTSSMVSQYLTSESLMDLIDREYTYVRYVHLLSSGIGGDGSINLTDLQFSEIGDDTAIDMSVPYIIKISTNMLCKNGIEANTRASSSYYSYPYNYFVNLSFTGMNDNVGINGTFEKDYKLNIGWNRIDWVVIYNPVDAVVGDIDRVFKINFNPVLDGTDVEWRHEGSLLNANLFRNSTELITGLFPDTTKLFPQLSKDAKTFNITSQNDNSGFVITTDSEITCNLSINNSHKIVFTMDNQSSNLADVITGYNDTDYDYFIDSIDVINMSNVPFNYDKLVLYSDGMSIVLPELFNYSQSITNSFTYPSVLAEVDGMITYSFELDGVIVPTVEHPHELHVHIVSKTTTMVTGDRLKIGMNSDSSINRVTIEPNGAVGIGSEHAHGYSLYVNNIGNSNKGIFCADDITVLSSRKYKKDIRPIDNPLEKIKRLQGVMYKRSDKEGEEAEKEHMGLILEDVREVVPEVCDDYGIKYAELVALLIESIKSINAITD